MHETQGPGKTSVLPFIDALCDSDFGLRDPLGGFDGRTAGELDPGCAGPPPGGVGLGRRPAVSIRTIFHFGRPAVHGLFPESLPGQRV